MTQVLELWQEALAQAQLATTEAQRRFAISALYFAVYHAACVVVEVDPTEGDSNHRRLVDALAGHSAKVASRLQGLKVRRVRAQYDLSTSISQQDVDLARAAAVAVRQMLRIDKVDSDVAQ